MTFKNQRTAGQAGLSLTEIIVAVAVTATLGTIATQFIRGSMTANQSATQENDKETIRNQIRMKFDCNATMSRMPANFDNTPVLIYDASGGSVFATASPANTMQHGDWNIKAIRINQFTFRVEASLKRDPRVVDTDLFKHSIPLTCP